MNEGSQNFAAIENAASVEEALQIISQSPDSWKEEADYGGPKFTHRLEEGKWMQIDEEGNKVDKTEQKQGSREHMQIINDLQSKRFSIKVKAASEIESGTEVAKAEYEQKVHVTIYTLNTQNEIEMRIFQSTVKEVKKLFPDLELPDDLMDYDDDTINEKSGIAKEPTTINPNNIFGFGGRKQEEASHQKSALQDFWEKLFTPKTEEAEEQSPPAPTILDFFAPTKIAEAYKINQASEPEKPAASFFDAWLPNFAPKLAMQTGGEAVRVPAQAKIPESFSNDSQDAGISLVITVPEYEQAKDLSEHEEPALQKADEQNIMPAYNEETDKTSLSETSRQTAALNQREIPDDTASKTLEDQNINKKIRVKEAPAAFQGIEIAGNQQTTKPDEPARPNASSIISLQKAEAPANPLNAQEHLISIKPALAETSVGHAIASPGHMNATPRVKVPAKKSDTNGKTLEHTSSITEPSEPTGPKDPSPLPGGLPSAPVKTDVPKTTESNLSEKTMFPDEPQNPEPFAPDAGKPPVIRPIIKRFEPSKPEKLLPEIVEKFVIKPSPAKKEALPVKQDVKINLPAKKSVDILRSQIRALDKILPKSESRKEISTKPAPKIQPAVNLKAGVLAKKTIALPKISEASIINAQRQEDASSPARIVQALSKLSRPKIEKAPQAVYSLAQDFRASKTASDYSKRSRTLPAPAIRNLASKRPNRLQSSEIMGLFNSRAVAASKNQQSENNEDPKSSRVIAIKLPA